MAEYVTIQCLRPFPGEHIVPCGTRKYAFTPNGRGHHTADVHPDDVFSILSISQGYQRYNDPDKAPDTEDVESTPDPVRTSTAEGEVVEHTRDYLKPATTAPKKNGRVNRTDQHKRRAREGNAAAKKAESKIAG